MESTRQKKISRLLQKELAEILRQKTIEIAPGKMITVTTVRVSPDLGVARVYLSIFPSADDDSVLEKTISHTKSIRYELGLKIRNQMRVIPELNFFRDDSLDYIENIDSLLKP